MTALFLGAHTDDIELGCGATFQQYGRAIYVAFSSCGKPELIDECSRATFLLKASEMIILNQQVREFKRQEVLDEMIELRKKFNPDIVYTHSSTDRHQDHQVVHEESCRAFKQTNLIGYELPWNDINSNLNTFNQITPEQLRKKVISLGRYRSQQTRAYMNANYITSLATVRGVQAGCQYAEAFESIRRF